MPYLAEPSLLELQSFRTCHHPYWHFLYTVYVTAGASRIHLGKESPNKTRLLSNMKARFKLTSPSPRGRSTIELLHEPFNRYSTRRFFATHTALTSSDALDRGPFFSTVPSLIISLSLKRRISLRRTIH